MVNKKVNITNYKYILAFLFSLTFLKRLYKAIIITKCFLVSNVYGHNMYIAVIAQKRGREWNYIGIKFLYLTGIK